MKNVIIAAIVASSALLSGCNTETKIYDCGDESFEVTASTMKSLNSGIVIDADSEAGEDHYKLFTPMGTARYEVSENGIHITVGMYQQEKTCKVTTK